MARWTVTFQDAPEMVKLRAAGARKAAHIAFVRAHPELQIGGDLALSPEQDFPGAIWHVQAKSREHVCDLVRSDPYFVPSLRQFQIHCFGKIFQELDVPH